MCMRVEHELEVLWMPGIVWLGGFVEPQRARYRHHIVGATMLNEQRLGGQATNIRSGVVRERPCLSGLAGRSGTEKTDREKIRQGRPGGGDQSAGALIFGAYHERRHGAHREATDDELISARSRNRREPRKRIAHVIHRVADDLEEIV